MPAAATSHIGKPTDRVDGRKKVTGTAKYAAEFNVPNLLHGYVVSSAIAKGKITRIDTKAALAVDGVVQVFTHENRPRKPWFDASHKDDVAPPGRPFRALYDENIVFSAQPIALVVAESFELACYAASLVEVKYDVQPHKTNLDKSRGEAYKPPPREGLPPTPEPRGNPDGVFASAAVRHQGEYQQPAEHHNPMETFASTVIYEADGRLTIYEKTQGVQNNQRYLADVLGVANDRVRVISPFVGGAFGSGLRPQYQLFLAAMAAIELKHSVKLVLTRQQMFSHGHRPNAIQNISLGSAKNGQLEAIIHKVIGETSTFEDYSEPVVDWSGALYKCDNVRLEHKVVKLNTASPCDMRAPGAATGLWALESAMDELAYKLELDPVELRLRNYAERNGNEDKPYSSKELRACYRQGAEKFGWSKRNHKPHSMKEGKNLIGWGMASGMWDAMYMPAGAKAVLTGDGRLEVSSATADIGTGTYTIMTQIAAETLGLPIDVVTFKLGDSTLPMSMVEGGSWTAASCGSAVKEVCEKIGGKLFALATATDGSPFAKAEFGDVTFADGHIKLNRDPSKSMAITEVMRRGKTSKMEEETDSKATYAAQSEKQKNYSRSTHSAVFVEVKVDEDLGTIHVTRVVSAVAAARILNPKTARSQILGAVVGGIGMALHEESVMDQNLGRFMNHSLAEYHVPVNADIHNIEVIFVEEHDEIVNPIGVKGVGEIGICGVAAAVANAVFHATGKRVRDLPITLDKLL
jgi:xanthine dehydrogenase YagR molybdenum-binding subunit